MLPPTPVTNRPTYSAFGVSAKPMITPPATIAAAPSIKRFLSVADRVMRPEGIEITIPGNRNNPINVPIWA